MAISLRTLLARVRKGVTVALATLLILLALLVGVGREVVKEIERFHQPLERWLSEHSALNIRFAKVRGAWSQASPELHFYRVSIANPDAVDAPPLTIAQLDVRLAFSNTLLSASPRLRLRVHDAEVHVDKHDNGFSLLGKPLQSQGVKSKNNPLVLLLDKPRISIYDSRLFIAGVYDRLTDARVSHLKLFWNEQTGFVDGQMVVRGPDEMKVAVKSEFSVLSRNGGEIQGRTYIALSEGQLARWIPAGVAQQLPMRMQGGRGNTEVWLHWFNNALLSSTCRFDWRDVQLAPENQKAYPLDRVAGTARWQGKFGAFWQLGLRNVTVESGNAKWRPSTLQINALHAVDEKRWLYDLTLADASFATSSTPLLALLPEALQMREAVAAMQPAGRLQDVYVRAQQGESGWKLMQAQGELREYSQKPWQKIPGVQNAGGAFLFDDRALWLDFNEQNVVLDYPAMFRNPLQLDAMQGSLRVHWQDDEIQVRSSPLRIRSAHGAAFTRLFLTIPRQNAVVPASMALQVTLRDIKAENASTYLPAGIIPEKLLAWLDGALKGGTLTQGDIVFNGALQKPEQESARSVLLGFMVEDGQLQFLPEWQEPITHLKGDVIVENGIVDAKAEGGEYYGLALDSSHVWTERVGEISHLHVQTSGNGDASAGMRLLRESPLGKTMNEALSDMTLQGPLAARFELDAPLAPKAVLAGKAVVKLAKGHMTWPAQRLEADKLDLALTYDLQKGLSTQTLQGSLLGGAVKGRLYQQSERAGRVLRLDLAGSTQVETLRTWLSIPQLALARGTVPYALQMQIRPAGSKQPGSLLVQSALKGTTIELPEPFGKESAEARDLKVQQTLGGNTRTTLVSYDDKISVAWESQAGRWQRGGIRLGTGQPVFSAQQTWRLTGALSTFRWSDWTPVIERLRQIGGDAALGGPSWLALFGDSNVTVNHLYLGDEELGHVLLGLQSDTHYVTVVASGERLQGRLTLPRSYLDSPAQRSAETPVSVYLQKLVLAGKQEDEATESDPLLDMLPPPATLDPRLLPSAHVRIDQLWAGADDRGRYNMTLHPVADGVETDNLRMTLKQVDFSGTARWVQRGDDARTYFKGTGVAKNAADVLTGWGYAPSLDSESAMLDMDVQWQGAPYQFKLARTEGNLQANLKNGHFLKVSNNAAGRVWGLLNFQTWMSRLQLRFNDLSDNEMPYKEIRGRFTLHNNQVQVNRLRIDSPSLKMKMDGLVDMSERQLNMQWYLTVPVTRNLMLPAAVVGGIPGAATAYVLDKVLASQLDKLTTLTYDVKGTFDQPQATLRIPLR